VSALRDGASAAASTSASEFEATEPASPVRFTPRWLATRLRALQGPLRAKRFCIAYSGGLDSSSLLVALAQLREREGFELRALHVDHGLHAQSGAWAAAAGARALAWQVPCQTIVLRLKIARGESLEAVARQARYRALSERLACDEALLTAHTQDDQLETMLLALLRGSGVRGLAAMRASTEWAHRLLLRPLLPIARRQLERFARARGLDWTEDATNLDERFDRNYLRRRVLPALKARWPAAAATASRSAAHLAEAQRLLERAACASAAPALDGAALRVSVLRRMSLNERANVLRWWIAARGLSAPDHTRLREIAGPMLAARADALPAVYWRGGALRRHGDRLLAVLPGAPEPAASNLEWDWRARSWLSLGAGRALGLVKDPHGDVDLSVLPCPLQVGYRRGGERMRSAHGRVALKDLLQSQAITPWERAEVPLVHDGERIVAVADLWIDAAYRVTSGAAPGRGRFRWRRGTPGVTEAAS
jgi:tRNA(Ile)-lysidine synthase